MTTPSNDLPPSIVANGTLATAEPYAAPPAGTFTGALSAILTFIGLFLFYAGTVLLIGMMAVITIEILTRLCCADDQHEQGPRWHLRTNDHILAVGFMASAMFSAFILLYGLSGGFPSLAGLEMALFPLACAFGFLVVDAVCIVVVAFGRAAFHLYYRSSTASTTTKVGGESVPLYAETA
ncbi:hypothetical protein LTR56_012193 [Elasticomyces elasticus]|nr:hypothetical protein LTR56_012193 [Elasticomyces elasticus]KAK3652994.1 hypothetical protein LTR22_011382 [Elasticomyces elasticus]KAK4919608.1 hypothetical protein LTR49_012828 [Elasticomyces elasticus]KAK5763148.1 hypothetical protein LTS12_006737 [Elasticomyces elasticus]